LLFENNYKVPFLSQVGLLLKEKRYTDRISSNDLLKIPQSIFSTTSSDQEDYHPSCSICLEVYSDGDVLRTLNCYHVFHKECIDIWLIGSHISKACPCCRSDPLQQQDQCSDISTQSFIRMGLNVSADSDKKSLQSDLSIEVDIDVDLEKIDIEIEEADDSSDSLISETTGNDQEAIVSLSSYDSDNSEDSRSWFIIANSP
jgi:hypothetical protein